MTPYLQENQITTVPGRLSVLWPKLAKPEQDLQLELASREVDRITRQDGGLWLQTDKTVRRTLRAGGASVILPNRPITAVSLIQLIHSRYQSVPADLAALQVDFGAGQTIQLSWPPSVIGGPFRQAYGVVFWPGDVIDVTYSCGLASVGGQLPAPIRQATRLLLEEALFGEVDNPSGLTRAGGDGGRADFTGRRNTELALEKLRPWTCVVRQE